MGSPSARPIVIYGRIHDGGPSAPQLPAEDRASVDIDPQLVVAGLLIQDHGSHNVAAARGVAIREVTLDRGHGRADYLLFVDGAPAA